MNKTLKLSFIALLSYFVAACGADTQVKTSFQSTKDVSKGESVYLDSQVVGEVVGVSQSGGKTHLEIELDSNGVNSVMSDAAIVVNRLKANSPLEIHNRQGVTEQVVNGQDIQGLDSMFQLGAWMVGDSVDLGAEAISGYVSAFQKYLEGDAWQNDKAQLTEQVKQATKAAEVVVAQSSQEIANVVEELKKAEEPMAQAVEQLGAELAPVITELGKSGQSIMQELEKLTQNLENQNNSSDREVGSKFMESLNKALENINDSMEKSLDGTLPEPLNIDVPPVTERSVPPVEPILEGGKNLPTATLKELDVEIESLEETVKEAVQEVSKQNEKVKL